MTTDNTELFELCKEVYERTGWSADMDRGVDYVWCHETLTRLPIDWDTSDVHLHIPLYTSDYLLEKLPEEVDRGLLVVTNGDRPHAGYAQRDQYGDTSLSRNFYKRAQYSDTPLKALLKLVIALHDAGVKL